MTRSNMMVGFDFRTNQGLRVVRLTALVTWFIACFFVAAASAEPQEYCAAFASHAANNKTGQAADANTAGDQKWQSAYGKALSACMDKYTSQQSKASSVEPSPRSKKAKPARKSQRVKKSKVSPASIQRKTARSTKPSRTRKSQSSNPSANASRTASDGKSLCRHLKVDSKGRYRIENCRVPKAPAR